MSPDMTAKNECVLVFAETYSNIQC